MSSLRVALGCLAGALLLLAGCGGDDGIDVSLRVVVADNNIREEGIECAGARPFGYMRAGAPFALEAGDGTVLAEGELPAGEAVNADPSIDWGVERIPTVCVLLLELEDVPERPSYRLRLPEGQPLEFERSNITPGEPLQLLVQ
ncbi:MAG: hypothetical protein ACRDNI_05110 [Gaiellaceae bacterium]